ncbi:hypothetical protein B5X24_HaOG215930 [Helicoverpa armigera]|nr:hypothetical protein B5X24_HaOG215930 [Helicoverpa armigera]
MKIQLLIFSLSILLLLSEVRTGVIETTTPRSSAINSFVLWKNHYDNDYDYDGIQFEGPYKYGRFNRNGIVSMSMSGMILNFKSIPRG